VNIRRTEVGRYANATEVIWCQEEPQNQGAWYRLRAMLRADIDSKKVLAYRRAHKIDSIAILRLEQQYPFPHEDYRDEVGRYAQAKEVVWCQEEPQNQSAWYRLRAYLRADIDDKKVLAYAGRSVSASPAVGYAAKHNAEQKKLVEDAFAEKLQSGEMVLAR